MQEDDVICQIADARLSSPELASDGFDLTDQQHGHTHILHNAWRWLTKSPTEATADSRWCYRASQCAPFRSTSWRTRQANSSGVHCSGSTWTTDRYRVVSWHGLEYGPLQRGAEGCRCAPQRYTTERSPRPAASFMNCSPKVVLPTPVGPLMTLIVPSLKPTMQQLIELRNARGSASATNSC